MDRPPQFSINHGHPLAQGLVFAGLGRHPDSTYYHDSSHYCNHGLLTNMDVPATATSGWAWDSLLGRWVLRFVSSKADLVSTTAKVTDASSGFSVAWWHNPTTFADYNQMLGTSGGWYEFLFHATSSGTIYAGLGEGGDQRFSAIALGWSTGSWSSICFTTTAAGLMRIYRNGVLIDTKQATISASAWTQPFVLSTATPSYAINGSIADPMIVGRVLTDAEISALADPSNTMLSGMLQYKRRRSFGFFAAASGFKPAWAARMQRTVGTGVI
jgi:hypothetical protein